MKNGTEKDHENSFGVREDEVMPTHAICGPFISACLHDICAGSVPVMLNTLYSNWNIVTKRLLNRVSTETFIVQAGPGLVLPATRWTGDNQLAGLAGNHLAEGALGYLGLSSFSFGSLVLKYALMRCMGEGMMEPEAMRKYDYLYHSSVERILCWKLLVNSMDVALRVPRELRDNSPRSPVQEEGGEDECSLGEVVINTWMFPEEMKWEIQTTSGSVVCSGGGYHGSTYWYSSLVAKCGLSMNTTYKLFCKDSYGEGWEGGSIQIASSKFCETYDWGKGKEHSIQFTLMR